MTVCTSGNLFEYHLSFPPHVLDFFWHNPCGFLNRSDVNEAPYTSSETPDKERGILHVHYALFLLVSIKY